MCMNLFMEIVVFCLSWIFETIHFYGRTLCKLSCCNIADIFWMIRKNGKIYISQSRRNRKKNFFWTSVKKVIFSNTFWMHKNFMVHVDSMMENGGLWNVRFNSCVVCWMESLAWILWCGCFIEFLLGVF
jgi:hypothetical protein